MRRSQVGAVVSVLSISGLSWALVGWAAKPATAVPAPTYAAAVDTATPPTRLQMQNVDFYVDRDIP